MKLLWCILLIVVVLTGLITLYCQRQPPSPPDYECVVTPDPVVKTIDGILDPQTIIRIEPIPPPNQILQNGRFHRIQRSLAGKEPTELREGDFCIIIFKIVNGNASGVKITSKTPDEDVYTNGDLAAKAAISSWHYKGNRQGFLAIKIDWENSSISIDGFRLEGTSVIRRVEDLVKSAYIGFSRPSVWECPKSEMEKYRKLP